MRDYYLQPITLFACSFPRWSFSDNVVANIKVGAACTPRQTLPHPEVWEVFNAASAKPLVLRLANRLGNTRGMRLWTPSITF